MIVNFLPTNCFENFTSIRTAWAWLEWVAILVLVGVSTYFLGIILTRLIYERRDFSCIDLQNEQTRMHVDMHIHNYTL